jgi:hypothetical protein
MYKNFIRGAGLIPYRFRVGLLIIYNIIFILLCTIMISCEGEVNNDFATVVFFNHSIYNVDIYHNFNPQFPDPARLLGTANTSTRRLERSLPPSTDLLLGDTFYLRYKTLLADISYTGTTNLYVPAELTMHNIRIILKSGQTETRIIEDPPKDELRFVNGYIRVHNQTTGQHWVENHGEILPQKGRDAAWLTLGQFGFYELGLPFLAESWPMDFLQSRDSHGNRTPFPSFEMERGKLYNFEIYNSGVRKANPFVTDLTF